VPEGLYERAVKLLAHERITDMIVLMGYYTAVSLTMNFLRRPSQLARHCTLISVRASSKGASENSSHRPRAESTEAGG
jgi:hypothetical protein